MPWQYLYQGREDKMPWGGGSGESTLMLPACFHISARLEVGFTRAVCTRKRPCSLLGILHKTMRYRDTERRGNRKFPSVTIHSCRRMYASDISTYLPLRIYQIVSTGDAPRIMEILSNLCLRLYRVALLSPSRSARREQTAREIPNGF